MASSPKRTGPNSSGTREPRRTARYVADVRVRISWLEDSGEVRMADARVLNISEHGLAVEMPSAPRRNSNVQFQIDRYRLSGTAAVRHVYRVGSRAIAGLEFVPGIRWKAPEQIMPTNDTDKKQAAPTTRAATPEVPPAVAVHSAIAACPQKEGDLANFWQWEPPSAD